VEQPGDFSDTPQPISSMLTLFHPLDSNTRQDSTAPHARSDITQVSSEPTRIHNYIPNTSVTLQASKESTGVPPTTVSDPQSHPVVMPSPPSGVIPAGLPLSIESAHVQPNHLSRPLGVRRSTQSPMPCTDLHHLFTYKIQGLRFFIFLRLPCDRGTTRKSLNHNLCMGFRIDGHS